MGVLEGEKLYLDVEQLGLDTVQVLTQALESLGATRAPAVAAATAILVNPSHPSYSPPTPSSSSPPHIPYNWLAACVATGTRIDPSAIPPPILLNHWRRGYLHQPITLYVSVNLRRRVGNENPEEIKSGVQSSLARLGAIIVEKRSKADVMIVDRKAAFFTDKIATEVKKRGRDWQRFGEREWADAVVRQGKMLPLENLEGQIMPGPEAGVVEVGPSSARRGKEGEGKAREKGDEPSRHATPTDTDVAPPTNETAPPQPTDEGEAATGRPPESNSGEPQAEPPEMGTGDGEPQLQQPPSEAPQSEQEQQVPPTTVAPAEAAKEGTHLGSEQPPTIESQDAADESAKEGATAQTEKPPTPSTDKTGHPETELPRAPSTPRDAPVQRLEEGAAKRPKEGAAERPEEGAAERLDKGATENLEEGAADQGVQPSQSEPEAAASPAGDNAPINLSAGDDAGAAQHDATAVDEHARSSRADAMDVIDDAINAATDTLHDATDMNTPTKNAAGIQQESRSEANAGEHPRSPVQTADEVISTVSKSPNAKASVSKQLEAERTDAGPSKPTASGRPRWQTANAAPIVNRPPPEDASPEERQRRAAVAEEERRRQREDSFAEDNDADAIFFKKGPGRPAGKPRKEYTPEDDNLLCRYLAFYHPGGAWSSRKTFETMVDRVNKYPWVSAHTFQSWHQRFKNNKAPFERRVKRLAQEGLDDQLRTREERQKEAARARPASATNSANGNAQPSGSGKGKENENEPPAKRKLVELSDGEEEPRPKKDPPPLRLGRQRNGPHASTGLIPSSRPRPRHPSPAARPMEPSGPSSQSEQPAEREPLFQPGPASKSVSPAPEFEAAAPVIDEGTPPPPQAAVEVTSLMQAPEQPEQPHSPGLFPDDALSPVEPPPTDQWRSPSPPPAGQAVPEPQSPAEPAATQEVAPSQPEVPAGELPSEDAGVSKIAKATEVVSKEAPAQPPAEPSQTSTSEHAFAPPTPPPAATPADAAVTPRAHEPLVPESPAAVGPSRPSAVADLIERRAQPKVQPSPNRRPRHTLATVSVPDNNAPSVRAHQRRASISSTKSTGKRRREPDTIAASPTVPPARRPIPAQTPPGVGQSPAPAPAQPQSQRYVPPPTLADRQRQFERGRDIVNENMAQYKANIQKWLREFDITGEEIRAAVATVRARTDLGRSPVIFDEVEAVLAEKYGRV